MGKEKIDKDSGKRKYRSFDLDELEERKLLILAAHKGYTSTRIYIKVLISEALEEASSQGLFNSLETEEKP